AGMLAVGRRSAADQGVENVNFVQAEANTPPAGPFDVVMAFNLLHLVEDLNECLNQAQSVLKPSGLFISKTFCPPTKGGSLKYRMIRIMLPLMQFFGRAPFVRFLSDSELDATIEKAGFKIIERDNFPMTDPRHFVVARKL
ncbi:MAG: class I SAM-dependent methyltransferase, partial [Ruegeria sp.]